MISNIKNYDTFFIEEDAISNLEFSRYVENTYFLCFESGDSQCSNNESLPHYSTVPTLNSTNGFRRQFEEFNSINHDSSSIYKLPVVLQ